MAATKQVKKANGDRSFAQWPLLWVVTGGLVGCAVFSAAVIIVNTPLKPMWTAEGFSNFVTVFTFPLSLLAITFPVVAFLASVHRSAQLRDQIRLVAEQNMFNNYFAHLEEFRKLVDIDACKKIAEFNTMRLHGTLYPNAKEGDFALDEPIKHIFAACFVEAEANLKSAEEGGVETRQAVIFLERLFLQKFKIPNLYFRDAQAFDGKTHRIQISGSETLLICANLRETYRLLKLRIQLIEDLIGLSSSFVDLSEKLHELVHVDLNDVPDTAWNLLHEAPSFSIRSRAKSNEIV